MTVFQYTFTNKQYTEQDNKKRHKTKTQNKAYLTIRIQKLNNNIHNLQN